MGSTLGTDALRGSAGPPSARVLELCRGVDETFLVLPVVVAAEKIEENLRTVLAEASQTDVLALADNPEVGRDVLRWWLLSNVAQELAKKGSRSTRLQDLPGLCFLCSELELLVACICSGGCVSWLRAAEIFDLLLQDDPTCTRCESSSCQLKLALASALCFADEDAMDKNMHEKPIDPVLRYREFRDLTKDGQAMLLGEPAASLEVWHWRYVVGSWHSNECLAWAREHVKQEIRCTDKIGQAARMVTYKNHNDKGVSVQKGLEFYGGKKSTMPVIFAEGGVCGAVSKFGASACQAFGVPAMPVGQPGHCAMIWRNNATGEWLLENDGAGWPHSSMHAHIQRTWAGLNLKSACVIPVMELAQSSTESYGASEKRRVAASLVSGDLEKSLSLLSKAIEACRYNLPAWNDFLHMLLKCSKESQSCWLATLQADLMARGDGTGAVNLALRKPVMASANWDREANLVDGSDSEWFPASQHKQWIEIDLLAKCRVEEVRIKWWGDYGSKTTVAVSSRSSLHEPFAMRGEVPQAEGRKLNVWSSLHGWGAVTAQVRLELSNPKSDCFGLHKHYGLRQVVVMGTPMHEDLAEPAEMLQLISSLVFCSSTPADIFMQGHLQTYLPPQSEDSSKLSILEVIPCVVMGPSGDVPLSRFTFGAACLQRASGCWYHEVKLGEKLRGGPFLGWVTADFLIDQEGASSPPRVGGDAHSWGADGVTREVWHQGECLDVLGSGSWSDDDVIGCALDLDLGEMSFSLNGEWVNQTPIKFEPRGRAFFPVVSVLGNFAVHLCARAWLYGPPPARKDAFQAWIGSDAEHAAVRSPLPSE